MSNKRTKMIVVGEIVEGLHAESYIVSLTENGQNDLELKEEDCALTCYKLAVHFMALHLLAEDEATIPLEDFGQMMQAIDFDQLCEDINEELEVLQKGDS